MSTLTTPETTKTIHPAGTSENQVIPKAGSKHSMLYAGLDLGTNTSFILAGKEDNEDYTTSKLMPSVVGYVREGLVNGILPTQDEIFYGEHAIENKLHLDLVWPLKDGIISDVKATKDFLKNLRNQIDPTGAAEIRAVIGMPANTSAQSKEVLRSAVTGIFDRILIIPEPFLAALGLREDKRLGEKNYVDPVQNSLFVDIGAGTTDLCLVQGYFPKANDQISFSFAGDKIDQLISKGFEQVYPDMKLSILQTREIKEKNAYVGASRRPIEEKVIISGKSQTIEVADAVGDACNKLLIQILEAVKELITRAPSESVERLLQNILITGGGSRIKGIDTELQRLLVEEGYANPKVRTAGEDYKRFVGIGAIKAARAARDSQWQVLFK